MKRPLARLTTALLAVAMLSAAFAAPAYADEEPPDPPFPAPACPTFTGVPSAETEFEAYQLARACGFDIQVLSLQDIDRNVYATPELTLAADIATEPYRVRDAAGAWVPIDPTLVVRPGGSASAAATVIRVETGAAGTGPFVTATDPGGGVLKLTWPGGPLPAPVVSGAVATYPEVLPGVDLAVQAESVGFSWVLVVKTAEAAANPALTSIDVGIEAVGLTVTEDPESGGIAVTDADGNILFEAGQAIMWDSSSAGTAEGLSATAAEPAAEPGRIGDVEVLPTDTGITLVPDTAMLADPEVTYPLYIDPPFTSTRKAWANVFDGAKGKGWTGDSSWPRSGGMRVGLNTWSGCGNGCGLWRSAITMNIGGLKGKYIASASVNMLQTHTGGCADQSLQLWRTGAISNGTSWNGIDWYYGDPLQTKSVPSSNQSGCSGKDNEWVEFDGANIEKRVQSAADQKHSTISFGVRSSSEGNRDAWRRIKISSVQLHVTYYVYPPLPDRLTIDGKSCVTNSVAAPWVIEQSPSLSARARTAESESVYLRMRVQRYNTETNTFYYRTPAPVGTNATVTRPVNPKLADGFYEYQARSDARQTDAVNSGYTPNCYFKVDATKPTVPKVTGPTGAVTAGSSVKLTVASTDSANAAQSGISHYEYSWGSEAFDQRATSAGSITLAAAPAGRHALYVRAVDKAGNESNHIVFTFFAGSSIPATVMGAWRFDGDHLDDTDHGKTLKAEVGAPTFAPDTVNPNKTVMAFDGNDCVTGPTSIRTDAAFTVSLRVRMDAPNGTGYSKVLTQGNTSHSMFQIQHDGATNTWSFSLVDTPGATYGWQSLSAPNPAALGQWLHIAATYDPDAGVSRLYFNGALAGERAVDFEPWNAIDRFSVGCLRTSTGAAHPFTGAVADVGVWQGLLSPTSIKTVELPAGEIAHWDLRGDGTDLGFLKRDLTLPESAAHGFDPFGRPNGALVLDGRSCATTSVPVVPGDGSFSIGTWVNPAQLEGRRQVLFSQMDARGDGFSAAITADGEWELGGVSGAIENTAIAPMSAREYIPPRAGWQYVQFHYLGSGKWEVSVGGRMGKTWTGIVPGKADAPLTIGCGSGGDHFAGMLHDVKVWRGSAGSDMGGGPADVSGAWSLEDGADGTGNGRELTYTGGHRPNDGFWNNPDGATEFTGDGSAATSSPAVATDESFTVGAWVRLDALDTNATVVSAAGAKNTAFRLRYKASTKLFEFTMLSADATEAEGVTFATATGGPTPTVGTWYFVVGTFDLRTKAIRLYVNGAEAGRNAGPANPWNAKGPLVIGAAAKSTSRWDFMRGRVDDVVVWQGTVSSRDIANMYGTNSQAGA